MTAQSRKIQYICPQHGTRITPLSSVLHGKGCWKCGRATALAKKNKTTLAQRQASYKQRLKQVAEDTGYTIVTPASDITNNITYITYICPLHGQHSMRLANLLSGKRCPDCQQDKARNRYQLSQQEVIQRIQSCGGKLVNPEVYINQSTRNLNVLCPECGNIFTTSLVLFTQHGGQVCDHCSSNESLGERRIRHWLEDHGIDFKQEHWFSDCRDIKPLPFDFYLPNYNMIIEFDGRQHFEEYSSGFFHDSLKTTQKHDEIKNQYCANHNIKIIRIPYWNYEHIEEILYTHLHEDIV